MTPATHLLIIRLLAEHCAEKRHARNLAREMLGLDHPIVGQHQVEVDKAEAAVRDFNDTQEIAA